MKRKEKQYWNKNEFLVEIKNRTDFDIAPITLWKWEKKGLFAPSGYMMNGKQKRPVYNEDDLKRLIKRIDITKSKNLKRLEL